MGLLGTEGDYVVTAASETLTSSATLDFGTGITPSAIAAISTSSLSVHLAIAADAPTGLHDVKLTVGTNILTGTGAFTVDPPVVVAPYGPSATLSAAQGSLLFADLTNLEPTAAWDPTYFTVTSPCDGFVGASVGGADTTASNAYVALVADPLAAVGTCGLVAGNLDAYGDVLTTESSDPAALKVTAGTPATLVPGKALTGQNIAAPGGAQYYSFDTSAVSIVDVATTAVAGGTIQPTTLAYPSTGVFADLLMMAAPQAGLFGTTPAQDVVFGTGATSATTFLVVFDSSYGGGASSQYGFSLKATVTPATPVAEQSTPHGTAGAAQALGAGPLVVSGALSTGGEMDVYSFTAAAGDMWELSYTESPNSAAVVETDISELPAATDGSPLAVLEPAAPSHSASNQGSVATITATGGGGDAGGYYYYAGTYYIAVVSLAPAGSAAAPYTLTLQNLAH
jgi:hypothetical protein